MSPYASMRIGSILPAAVARVEQLTERVRERELAEAIREANQDPPIEWRHYNGIPRSVIGGFARERKTAVTFCTCVLPVR